MEGPAAAAVSRLRDGDHDQLDDAVPDGRLRGRGRAEAAAASCAGV
jgi:hypothetical protein